MVRVYDKFQDIVQSIRQSSRTYPHPQHCEVPHLPRRPSHSSRIGPGTGLNISRTRAASPRGRSFWRRSLAISRRLLSVGTPLMAYLMTMSLWMKRTMKLMMMHQKKMFHAYPDLLEVVVEQSNLYAIQCDTNKPLNITTKELEQFMGTAVYMSLFGLPGTRMFWNKATRVSQVADTMALNRWEFIKKSLHFNNNNQVRQGENVDLLHKIRPLVTHLTLKLQTIPMGEKLAVDEQMVPFKGRNRLKPYLPSKPKRWGYKILILAGSDGVPAQF
ncbi:hypothetical protein FQN60_002590 [Etheostoma spectabile]|uniref:PiggyBac transposable element-derived protein domain-containing protein n=1 Tax=Etheostoma spectabile TaxID=54343 RepID=A0A5J5CCC6_9PERO|nr:hypothetical protein FQN60_002590 [Etheostoma spectabile]